MTVFEILNFNKELLNRLTEIGYKPEDCKYIDLYSDYERMRRNGDKVTYIVNVLADKYDVSERKVYGVIKRFGKDCTLRAVWSGLLFCSSFGLLRPLQHQIVAAMRKEYLSAPLPFVGQKRMFAKEYKRILATLDDNAVFVDLFGGSGLLSHITKYNKPNATVVYNDYDNYRQRLENIDRTNRLLADLRVIVKDCPRHKLIDKETRELIFERLEREEQTGFVDYITVSSSLLFSMKYVLSLDALRKEGMYNNVRKNDYSCDGFLDGLEIASCDYRELFEKYKDNPNVVFLVDPPYLCTEVGTYNMSWTLADYLDVLTVLQGKRFVYFTSNKSSIIELCDWLGNNQTLGNPFENARKIEFNAHMNYNSQYTDIMLYRIA